METLSVRTLSVSSISSYKKLRNSSFSLSCKDPPNRSSTPKAQYNYNPPTNPFCFSVSALLHTIKDLAFTRRWASPSRDSVELDQFPEIKDDDYLRSSSGIGMALLSTTMAAKVHISPFLGTLAANPTFISGLMAWAVAQIMKVFLNFYVERKWDLRILFSSGGMPSSHSALCMALTTSVALCHGVGDSLFPVCLGFSLIVMYDATGVRRHAGMQAEVLNLIIEDLFQWHPISQRKLKELLGHTPSQVIAGAILGILVACCCQGRFIAS